MRRKQLSWILIICLPILGGCPSSGSSTLTSASVPESLQPSAPPSDDERLLIEKLQRINVQAATQWMINGIGYLGYFNSNYAALLAYPNGSCAQRSYVFARWVMQQTGLRVRRMGLFALDGRNDLMVEVDLQDRTYLFAPTAGVYFPFSLGDLIENPNLAMSYVGTPLNGGQLYLDPTFFGTLDDVDVHESLNDSEYDYSLVGAPAGINLFPYPNDASAAIDGKQSTYAAGVSSKMPQALSVSWGSPVQAYRIWIDWYDVKNYSDDFDLVLHLSDGTDQTLHVSQAPISDIPATEIVLPGAVSLNAIDMIVYSSHGQGRLLVNELGVY